MIHYSCDCCKRILSPEELRYVVKIEVAAAIDPVDIAPDGDDRDHLEEVDEVLAQLEEMDDPMISDDILQYMRFDLCSECRKHFIGNPLSRRKERPARFSEN